MPFLLLNLLFLLLNSLLQVPGSPFACKVYNVNAIKVRECVKGIVGKPVTFLVETSHAGPGNLEVNLDNLCLLHLSFCR